MRKIKDIATKPSEALQFMVDGLLSNHQRYGFQVNMSAFGVQNANTCYGCAATCAIQAIAKKQFVADEHHSIESVDSRAEFLGFGALDLSDFELTIDATRRGNVRYLFDYYGLPWKSEYPIEVVSEEAFSMTTTDWLKQIPVMQRYINYLKTLGV